MLVELGQTQDCVNHIGLLVHHNDRRSAQTRSSVSQIVEVHDSLFALVLHEHTHGRATGNNGLEIVPSADHATCVSFY